MLHTVTSPLSRETRASSPTLTSPPFLQVSPSVCSHSRSRWRTNNSRMISCYAPLFLQSEWSFPLVYPKLSPPDIVPSFSFKRLSFPLLSHELGVLAIRISFDALVGSYTSYSTPLDFGGRFSPSSPGDSLKEQASKSGYPVTGLQPVPSPFFSPQPRLPTCFPPRAPLRTLLFFSFSIFLSFCRKWPALLDRSYVPCWQSYALFPAIDSVPPPSTAVAPSSLQ